MTGSSRQGVRRATRNALPAALFGAFRRVGIHATVLFLSGARIASGQFVAEGRVGFAPSVLTDRFTVEQSVLTRVLTESTSGHSTQYHVVVGMITGLAIGVGTGLIVGQHQPKRCSQCDVQGAFGPLVYPIELGVAGTLVGGVVGALWPRA